MQHLGIIQDKKFIPDTPEVWKMDLQDNRRVVISITKEKSKRSIEQNAYYWVLLQKISDDLGFTIDELHLFLKYTFIARPYFRLVKIDLPLLEINVFLERFESSSVMSSLMEQISTTKLKTDEFKEYIEEIIDYFVYAIGNDYTL